MYKDHFGLADEPFSIAPDPRYLFMTERHREALAHLLFGLQSGGGFVLLTGEVGTGKTTICRSVIEQAPDSAEVAFILNPKLTVEELLETVCEEFGIAIPQGNRSIKVFVERINAFLLDAHAKGHSAVVIIDEAQNLSADVLEQMRLLTNLETSRRKLLHVILLGHPELKDKLAAPELRQLAQRIIARYHLGPLTKEEVAGYIQHRLSVAGARGTLFPPDVVARIYRLSGGIPRLINMLCDRSLLGAYAEGKDSVTVETLARAAGEVFGREPAPKRDRRNVWWALGAASIVASTAALVVVQRREASAPMPLAPAPALPSPTALPPVAPAAPVATPIERPAFDSLTWPATESLQRSEAMAWASVFRRWNLAEPRGPLTYCDQAENFGLRCFLGRGGPDALRRDDHPAVVQFKGTGGRNYFGAVLAINEQTATVAFGATTRTVPLSDFAANVTGPYTLLWRIPANRRSTISTGARGPSVDWLARQLALSRGETAAPVTGRIFDDKLTEEVKRFQLDQGLNPDGAVGPQTLIRLGNIIGTGVPKLGQGVR